MLKNSWRIAQVMGVNIYIHWSFLLIPALIILQGAMNRQGIGTIAFIFVILFFLFICVILHELGHAWTALYFKVPVKHIILLPIGGLAQMESTPKRPWQEICITLAGPLMNLLVALGLATILFFIDAALLAEFWVAPLPFIEIILLQTTLWQYPVIGLLIFLLFSNIVLFVFNLVPAYPMDGGRLLRALLLLVFSEGRSTQLAIGAGQALAFGLLYWGTQSQIPGLIFAGFFVFLAGLPLKLATEPKRTQTRLVNYKPMNDETIRKLVINREASKNSHSIDHKVTLAEMMNQEIIQPQQQDSLEQSDQVHP